MADVFIALVHYPVYNKNREVIASALTTIDLHDLARLAATYELAGFYVVTPLEDQRRVAEDMITHWCQGWGAGYNQTRSQALSLARLARDLNEVKAGIAEVSGREPVLVATSAGEGAKRTAFSEMTPLLAGARPLLIIFGTAWGLTEEALADCDILLEPIKGRTKYNHLSVRSAAGIILDRLMGRT